MHRIRKEREASGEESADDLDGCVRRRYPERESERTAVPAAIVVVVVPTHDTVLPARVNRRRRNALDRRR